MEATIDRDALDRYVGRVLVLHEERKSLNADIAVVYEEAKSAGFVTKIIRQIVREQQMDAEEREAHYNLLDTYRHALGMLADTPLGEAAMAEAEADMQEEASPPPPRRRPFAEQPVHRPRSRPRKAKADLDALEPAGAA